MIFQKIQPSELERLLEKLSVQAKAVARNISVSSRSKTD